MRVLEPTNIIMELKVKEMLTYTFTAVKVSFSRSVVSIQPPLCNPVILYSHSQLIATANTHRRSPQLVTMQLPQVC